MTEARYIGKISPILMDNWTDNVPSYYSYFDFHLRRKAAKKKLKKERTVFFLTAVILVCTLLMSLSVSSLGRETYADNLYHAVDGGETLWSIAEDYKGEDVSTGEFVYEIKKINDLTTSEIYEGQLLIIPE